MSTVTTYLEMHSPDQLRPKRCADGRFQIREKKERNWRFNRDLYLAVGEMWSWDDKRVWTDEQWKEYGLAPELRTFGAYYDDSLAGYYELRRDDKDGVEIAYFGLLPKFIVADLEAHYSPVQSKKRGGRRLQSLAFGCIPARVIIRVRWPITKPAAW